jgi:DMSO/TMAO reductase YedYZ molybdopterin-dependent catalytic subunit
MPRRLTNLLLLALVLAQVASGVLGWVLPEARALPLYDLHRGLGLALVVLLAWKQVIVRSSLRRRLGRSPWDRSVLVGAVTALALLGSLGLGLAWTLNLVSFESLWGYSPLNLHVALGLALVPLVLLHLARRWERKPAAPDLVSRRSALRLIGLSAATLVSWRLVEQAAEAFAEGSRRASGSKHAGSFTGNDFPITIWLFDTVPALDVASWRLQVGGNVARPGSLSYRELVALPAREARAVLDCTGGWWSEQVWRGVAVGDLLAACDVAPSAREATVVSVTGHRWSFPLDELRSAVLATHVGDEELSPGHGYPLRLVVPGRRGFQWVKWVGRIEVA